MKKNSHEDVKAYKNSDNVRKVRDNRVPVKEKVSKYQDTNYHYGEDHKNADDWYYLRLDIRGRSVDHGWVDQAVLWRLLNFENLKMRPCMCPLVYYAQV